VVSHKLYWLKLVNNNTVYVRRNYTPFIPLLACENGAFLSATHMYVSVKIINNSNSSPFHPLCPVICRHLPGTLRYRQINHVSLPLSLIHNYTLVDILNLIHLIYFSLESQPWPVFWLLMIIPLWTLSILEFGTFVERVYTLLQMSQNLPFIGWGLCWTVTPCWSK